MKQIGAFPITWHKRQTGWDFTVKSHSWNYTAKSGFLTSYSESEAILLTVNILSEATYTGYLLTVRKDRTKLVQCTPPLAQEPIMTMWEEGDKETQSKSQMNYNTVSCEQYNGRSWASVISTPQLSQSHRVIRAADASLKGTHTRCFLSLSTALNWKWPKCPSTKTDEKMAHPYNEILFIL